jgi:hypothetical protein
MSDLLSPLATISQNPNKVLDQYGNQVTTSDPAWQSPSDPLDISAKKLESQAKVISREIPITVVQTGWSIQEVRQAIEGLVVGLFDQPAQLVDAITGDSRVQSAMQSRVGGLLGKEIRHKLPTKYKDSSLAKECYDAWTSHWPNMATEAILADMQLWGSSLGFWTGQSLWDTSGDYWLPYLSTFHPRYTYYHWLMRKYVAITLDGQVPITPGDGHWVMHAPYGMYRGWMRGNVRPIAPWWLARNYALRDWARHSERHGMPIGLAITPFGAAPDQISNYRNQLANLGQESIIQLPQSPDPQIGSYDLKWLETNGQSWDGFAGLITQCNSEITLSILGQNLTSEVKEGSFAAARVHADVRQSILEFDARVLTQTIYTQLARPFAAINFGNPDLAPKSYWDITPYEDNKAAADTFVAFASAVNLIKSSGNVVTDITELAAQFGLRLSAGQIKQIQSENSPIRAYHLDAGVVTVNEVRKSIGLPPIEGDEGERLLKPEAAATP